MTLTRWFLAGLAMLLTSFALAASPPAAEIVSPGSCRNINEALGRLSAEGGTVYLARGLFLCDKPVVLRHDRVSLIGSGRGETILRVRAGRAFPVLILGETETQTEETRWGPQFYPSRLTSDLLVAGLTVDGNMRAHPSPGENECFDPPTGRSLNCAGDGGQFIRNNGLTIRRAQNVRVHDIETISNFSGGIVLEKRCENILIDGFVARENFFDGFAGYETKNSVFRHFEVSGNFYSGVSVDLGFEGNRFEDGRITDNGDNGVFSANVGQNEFIRLHVTGNRNYGFYFDGTNHQRPDGGWDFVPHTCDGNSVSSSFVAGPRAGVRINSACEKTSLVSLEIVQPQEECLSIAEGAHFAQRQVSCHR